MFVLLEGGLGDQLSRLAISLAVAERHNYEGKIYLVMQGTAKFGGLTLGQSDTIQDIEWGDLAKRLVFLGGRGGERTFWHRIFRFYLVRAIKNLRQIKACARNTIGRDILWRCEVGSTKRVCLPSQSLLRRAGWPHELSPILQTDRFREMVAQLRTAESIGVHIRLGDFKTFANGAFMSPKSYFTDALALVRRSSPRGSVYLFSDEPDEAKGYFQKGISFVMVASLGFSPIEEMCLLSRCGRLILSNSSFSGWAARMSALPRTRIVQPQNMFLNFIR